MPVAVKVGSNFNCLALLDLSYTRTPQLSRLHGVNISLGVSCNAVTRPHSRSRHLLVPYVARDSFGSARKGITMPAAPA